MKKRFDLVAPAPPQLTILGRKGRGGAYVLRFHVARPFAIPCGRFRRGRPVAFAAGEYLYVGSAAAQQGASCLAWRLVRHASRLRGGKPHLIRELMLKAFPCAALCDGDVTPRGPKKPKWNIDHPLNHPSSTMTGAYLIRTRLNIEAALGKFLESDPATVAFEPGLGANDIKGNTHLLRVDAGEAWWAALPAKLGKFHRLSNMWPARASTVLARVAGGTSFSRAVRESEAVYDTWDWAEVLSRLWRGRGSVLKAAAVVTGSRSPVRSDQQRRLAGALAAELKADVSRLRAMLALMDGGVPAGRAAVGPVEFDGPAAVDLGAATFNEVMWMLRCCGHYVAKNARDIPLIRPKTGVVPVAGEMERAGAELRRIGAGVDVLVKRLSPA